MASLVTTLVLLSCLTLYTTPLATSQPSPSPSPSTSPSFPPSPSPPSPQPQPPTPPPSQAPTPSPSINPQPPTPPPTQPPTLNPTSPPTTPPTAPQSAGPPPPTPTPPTPTLAPNVDPCVGILGVPLATPACCRVLKQYSVSQTSDLLCGTIRNRLIISGSIVNNLVTLKASFLYKACLVSIPSGFSCPVA